LLASVSGNAQVSDLGVSILANTPHSLDDNTDLEDISFLLPQVRFTKLTWVNLHNCPLLPADQLVALRDALESRKLGLILCQVYAFSSSKVRRVRQNSSSGLAVHKLPKELVRMVAEML
jgi:hypothetical protein